jgi:hypothetical protein
METEGHVKNNACAVEIKIKWMIRKDMTHENTYPLPIDLSTENTKAKRSAYEKDRRPGRSFNRKWKDKMNKQMTT